VRYEYAIYLKGGKADLNLKKKADGKGKKADVKGIYFGYDEY
jgi:hypothetical protein